MRSMSAVTSRSAGGPGRREERGQILVLFALMLTALTLLCAVLYSAAGDLVLRRQLQNAGDAAALAASNLMTQGTAACNSTRIASSGTGNDLYTAAKNSLITNLGWTAAQVSSRMTISCPSGYSNVAVRVTLSMTGPRWFGTTAQTVATSSTGINGQYNGGDYSVALLDPSNPLWGTHRVGCPSYLINGGVTVTYEGSVFIDSVCKLTDSTSGSVKAGNSAFSMTMVNSAKLITRGEVQANTVSKITPTPTQDWPDVYDDPLGGLTKPCHAGSGTSCLGLTSTLPPQNTSTTGTGHCKSMKTACVLSPGTYTGGILAANGNELPTLLLRPGVYYIAGGGLQLKSSVAQIIAIPALTGTCGGTGTCSDANAVARYCNPTTQTSNGGSCQLTSTQVGTNWASDCPTPPASSTCGVLIYNAMVDGASAWATSGGSSDAIQNGSFGVLLLRGYNPTNDTIAANGTTSNSSTFASYKNLIVWQARDKVPGPNLPQPVVGMTGGACVVMSGTVYASGAEVDFGGSTCGTSGGADAQLVLQFVCWDLTLAGNNNFYFAYNRAAFAQPWAYGLVQ
jgi:hypothetical protein